MDDGPERDPGRRGDPLEEDESALPSWWRRGRPTPRLDPRLFVMMVVVLAAAVLLEQCWSSGR